MTSIFDPSRRNSLQVPHSEYHLPLLPIAYEGQCKRLQAARDKVDRLSHRKSSAKSLDAAGYDAERSKAQIRAIKEKNGPIAAELHTVEQARRQHVARRLSAIFRAYQCSFRDWGTLLERLSEADPSWDASSAVSTDMARMMGPPKPGAREVCLVRLLELPKHFRVEPLRPAPAPPRNAARDRMIVYMMIGELTGAPGTGRPSSPSGLQAARRVQTRIAEMGPDAVPSVHTIRKVWTDALESRGSLGFDGTMFAPPQRVTIFEQRYHYRNSIYRQLRGVCLDLDCCRQL